MAILITARHTSCQYEWIAHEPHAHMGSLPDAVIEAIRDGKRPPFEDSGTESAYECCVEAHDKFFVSDTTYQRVLDRFGIKGTVGLTS